MDDLEDGPDESHHSDDSCLLHEFTSATCSSRATSTPIRSRLARRSSTPCCSTSSTLGRTPAPSSCLPCPITSSRPTNSSLRAKFAAVDFEDFRSRIESLKRELKSSSESAEATPSGRSSWGSGKTERSSCSGNNASSRMVAPFCAAVSFRPFEEQDERLACGCDCMSWNVSLIRALRKDPGSIPERRADGKFGTIRTRQPGRADVGFSPRKGDLIIHHEKTPGRKVVEFYDPVSQRLQDGDILVRFRIDSYACEGIVLVKGSGYVYHRGFWVYLGKDSDQISRSCIL